jgi:hypothetical protein
MLAESLDDDHPISSQKLYDLALDMWKRDMAPHADELSATSFKLHLRHLIHKGYIRKEQRGIREIIYLRRKCDYTSIC